MSAIFPYVINLQTTTFVSCAYYFTQKWETRRSINNRIIKRKAKSIPLQAWTGPEGSRRLRLPDFKTVGT